MCIRINILYLCICICVFVLVFVYLYLCTSICLKRLTMSPDPYTREGGESEPCHLTRKQARRVNLYLYWSNTFRVFLFLFVSFLAALSSYLYLQVGTVFLNKDRSAIHISSLGPFSQKRKSQNFVCLG